MLPPASDYSYECWDCKHKFFASKPEELEPDIKCPTCGSLNVHGDSIKQSGPFDVNTLRHY